MHPNSHSPLTLKEISHSRLMGICRCVSIPVPVRRLVSILDLDENPHVFTGLMYKPASATTVPSKSSSGSSTQSPPAPGLLERLFINDKSLRVSVMSCLVVL